MGCEPLSDEKIKTEKAVLVVKNAIPFSVALNVTVICSSTLKTGSLG
jgi:hypothetical protein